MDFLFSVVMAVFNTEPYLRAAVDSLIHQDFSFDKIQLILVDDGSTDGSSTICDEYAARYPENVLVIHKENGGVSSARNAGLEHAQGKYVNFLDSDDRMSSDTFSKVYSFFETHDNETDVVSIPLYFFEGKKGPHILNNKFEKGTRIIDLRTEWTLVQLSGSSTFIRRECFSSLRFNPQLRYAEDAELLQRILLKKQTLGVVAEAAYHYRFRSGSVQSAIQSSTHNPANYLPKIKLFHEALVSCCLEELGMVPKFIQFVLMYDLQWYARMQELPSSVLSSEEKQDFLLRLAKVLVNIDDDVILAQKHLEPEHWYYLLSKKYGNVPQIAYTRDGFQLICDGRCVGTVSGVPVTVDFIRLEENRCLLEGSIPVQPGDSCHLFASFNGEEIPCEALKARTPIIVLGEMSLEQLSIRLTIPLLPGHSSYNFSFTPGCEAGGQPLPCVFNRFSPISARHRNAYYCHAGWCIQYRDGVFAVSPVKSGTHFKKELLFLRDLFFSKNHQWKASLIRLLYWMLKPWKRKPLWLISDRRLRAGDNGEAFFRYLRKSHPEIDARFVLRNTAKAWLELRKIGRILENDTIEEMLLSLLSDYTLSSQTELEYYSPLFKYNDAFRDVLADRHFIFLQHGVTKDDISGWSKKTKKNYYGFITVSKAESTSIVDNPAYGYSSEEVWLTGFPRFDFLKSADDARMITIMPTWRRYLSGELDRQTMMRTLCPDFSQSSYYRFYSSLLSDKRLLDTASRFGYRLAFFPHPNIQQHINLFHFPSCVRILGLETEYRIVYEQSALLVTDYSSAVFDFAYMKKPVLYTQFDRDVFFAGDHVYRKGYFDYEKDGFGEVEYDLDSTVNRIIDYMQKGCVMKPEYQERVDRFFAFHDRNNCQRLYDRLKSPEP